MARNVVDELVVRLTADATRLQAELGKAETNAKTSGRRIGESFAVAFKSAARIGATTAAVVGTIGTAFIVAANKAAAYADQIDKTAIRTRLSRGALQELAFAADQAGVEFNAIEANIRAFTGRLAEAEKGSVAVAGTFNRLGVSLRDQNGALRDTESLFLDTLSALSGLENETERAALAVQAFGEQGSALLPFLNLGATGLDDLRAKARELGLVLGDEAISTLVQYKDEVSAVSQQFGALGRDLVLTFLPILTDKLIPFLTDSAIPALQDLIAILGGESSGLRFAANGTARALASGDPGSLSGALEGVIDKLGDDGLKKALRDAQAELRLTGTVGVTAAQNIERALAVIRAQADLTQNLLRFNPAEAALRQAGASVFGSRAVPNADVDVRQLIQAGDIAGAYNVALSALETLTTPVSGSLADPVPFRSGAVDALEELVASLRVSLQSIASAGFVPTPEPTPTPNPFPDGGPAGTDTDPVVVAFSRTATPVLFAEQRLAAQQGANGTPRTPRDFTMMSDRGAARGDGGLGIVLASRASAEAALIESVRQAGSLRRQAYTIQAQQEAAANQVIIDSVRDAGALRRRAYFLEAQAEAASARDARAALLAGIGAGAPSDRGRTRGSGLMQGGDVFTPPGLTSMFPTGLAADLALRDAVAAQRAAVAADAARASQFTMLSDRGLARGDGGLADAIRIAQEQQTAADRFANTVIDSAFTFTNELVDSIRNGDVGGAFQSLLKGAGGIVGAGDFGIASILGGSVPIAAIASGAIGLIANLFGGLFGGPQESEAARAAGARPGGAPAIELNLSVFQNLAVNSLTGGDRAAVDGLLDQTVSRIESVLVSFGNRLTAVEARTA